MELVFPVIFLLPIHLGSEELHELKEKISTLTYNATEAEIFLGKITQKKRALTELRHLKVNTEEVVAVEQVHLDSAPPAKRRKIWSPHKEVLGDDLATISDTASGTAFDGEVGSTADHRESAAWNTVKVVKLAWLTDSLKEGVVLPLDDYVIYEGCKLSISSTAAKAVALTTPPSAADDILRRAQTDIGITSDLSSQTRLTLTNLGRGRNHQLKRPPLLTETTSEDVAEHSLPPVPDYLHTMYACQRPSPKHPPNEMFVEELEKIRTFRTLLGDQIGVRAYSTAISSLRAYPYTLTTPPGELTIEICLGN